MGRASSSGGASRMPQRSSNRHRVHRPTRARRQMLWPPHRRYSIDRPCLHQGYKRRSQCLVCASLTAATNPTNVHVTTAATTPGLYSCPRNQVVENMSDITKQRSDGGELAPDLSERSWTAGCRQLTGIHAFPGLKSRFRLDQSIQHQKLRCNRTHLRVTCGTVA